MVRPAYVWDASQTTGEPIPEPPAPQLLEGQAPAGLWEGLATQVAKAGFELRLVADATEIFGANGLTDYSNRVVSVRSDMDPAAQVKTLATSWATSCCMGRTPARRGSIVGLVRSRPNRWR